MDDDVLFERYRDLQTYVGWTPADAERVAGLRPLIEPSLDALIADFYSEIQRHPQAAQVLQGTAQIERLKQSLRDWLLRLLSGPYDTAYVVHRSRVGRRHVEIGLQQVYTNAALSRLRNGVLQLVWDRWTGQPDALRQSIQALNRLLDLDLAIIEDAYEREHLQRHRRAEHQRMAAALHEEKEFSDRLIEQAQAIVLVLDPEGRVIRYNRYTEALTGYPLTEAQGQSWFERFLPKPERERLRTVFDQTFAGLETTGTVNQVQTRDGRLRNISWSNTTLRDVDGESVAVLAIGHDVTELGEAQMRMLQAERLAAIGQMITGLAHESRNALQRIQACSEMLELEVDGNAEALDLLARIQAAQDHLHRLFEEVRGYAAPIQLQRSKVRLNEAWREAWELLSEQRDGRQTELTEHSDVLDLLVIGDHFRLVQVFRNLMENSLAACPQNARVSIRCTDRPGPTPAIEVTIRDNGQGMDEQQRQRIFEPFFTTKTKGTGLGMSIAQRIIEAHGGTIEVGHHEPRSDAGQCGAEIVVILPREPS